MKPSKPVLAVLAVILVLVLVKVLFLSGDGGSRRHAAGGADVAVNVTVYVVHPRRTEKEIYTSGTVLANEQVNLMPEASGKITRLLFREGTHVHRGDLLVKINDADLQAQLAKLTMQVKLAEDEETRQRKLLEVQGVSREDYDRALNNLNSLKADADYMRAQIEKTELRAPFDGVIGLRQKSEGAYVTPQDRIATLLQPDPVKLDFSVPVKYAGQVNKGDTVEFTLEGHRQSYTGVVYALEPDVDVQTRTLGIRARCPNHDGAIVPGAFARVRLLIGSSDSTLAVPTEAIVPVLKGQQVFVCRYGLAEARRVETGVRTDRTIEITDGLHAGDSVVTTGVLRLRDGSPLHVTAVKPKP